MPQIALVSDKHDDDIAVRMIPQLFQPSRHILECLVLGDIIDQQCAHSATIVCRSDSPVALLSRGIPNLGLDRLGVDLDAAGCEFDANRGLGIEVELVASETLEKIGFTDAGVSD